MATIGLKDLFVAPVSVATGGVETWGTPKRLAKAINAKLSVEVAEAVLYADDGVDEIVKEFVSGELELEINDLLPEDSAMLLGQTQDDDGVVFAGDSDEAPYFAVGFRARKTRGNYKYIWLYKVKFSIPDEEYKTKGDGVEFNTPTITGQIIKRDLDGNWKADFVGTPESEVAKVWFDEVREPNVA